MRKCHTESKTSPASVWGLLTPELIQTIASYLHNNDVVENLKLANKETAAALKARHVLQLARKAELWPRDQLPPRAESPWPCVSFVEHCRRAGAWRGLSLHQRRRLVCLASSCGNPSSLDAALAHCGCSIHHSALDAAVAVGDVSACEALLGAGAGGCGSRGPHQQASVWLSTESAVDVGLAIMPPPSTKLNIH